MSNTIIQEIVRQLMTGRPVCVCKPFCGHWEAHAAKVLSSYLSGPLAEAGVVQLRNAAITYAKKHGPIAAIKFVADQVGVVGLIGDSETDDPPRHHKNCSIWTVTRDGNKNACDCGLGKKLFLKHLEYASKLAATWEPWERHILSGDPCRVDTCPCQHPVKKHEVLCRCGSTPEVKWISGSYPEPDDHCPEGSWVVRCTNSAHGLEYFGLTRNDAIDYWNSQQLDVDPYPFGRVSKNESDNTERR